MTVSRTAARHRPNESVDRLGAGPVRAARESTDDARDSPPDHTHLETQRLWNPSIAALANKSARQRADSGHSPNPGPATLATARTLLPPTEHQSRLAVSRAANPATQRND